MNHRGKGPVSQSQVCGQGHQIQREKTWNGIIRSSVGLIETLNKSMRELATQSSMQSSFMKLK